MNMNPSPTLSALADRELSLKSRLAFVALLLVAMMMTAVVGSLWLTEPGLPFRTEVFFGVMTAIGAGWIVFALWVLTSRRVLLAFHAVVAGRMAVACSALFLLGMLVLALGTDQAGAYGAAAAGAAMLAGAIVMLLRARRKLRRLVERRAELERRLRGA